MLKIIRNEDINLVIDEHFDDYPTKIIKCNTRHVAMTLYNYEFYLSIKAGREMTCRFTVVTPH